MTTTRLRELAIWSGLSLTCATLLFFIMAPMVGFPLTADEGWQLAQISLPVFLGYLGSAAQFAIGDQGPDSRRKAKRFLTTLLVGPLVIYIVAVAALLWGFAWSNRTDDVSGDGMTFKQLSTIFTSLLSILAVSTSLVVAMLFRAEPAGRGARA